MVKNIKSDDFKPIDITSQDDACHLKQGFGRIETWYYDAIFENNYSIVTIINIVHIGRFGLVLTGLFIYKDSKPIKIIRKRYPLSDFFGDEDKPLIKIREKEFLKGYINDENNWITHIHIDEDEIKIDLDFIKKSKGFKGKTYLGKWLVIPKMVVLGEINLGSKKIEVKGLGYHDHNIYPIYAPFKTKGYYFGKLDIDTNNNITWARVIKNRNKQQLLAILSKDGEYYNIPNKSINYEILNQVKDHKKIMPTRCSLNINSDIIKLKLNIETINYHYIGILVANYWRYHVRYQGEIEIDSKIKQIDNIEITEYLKFF
jgi:hypothetical protein